jgi:hypothetical protein
MNTIHLIAVFVENKPGQTARVTKVLAEAGISICWVTIANSGSFGVLKFLVDKTAAAVEALNRSGFMATLLEALAVETENHPGALRSVADALAQRNINLSNCSGFVANHRAILLVEVQETEGARAILEQRGFRLLSQDQIMKL